MSDAYAVFHVSDHVVNIKLVTVIINDNNLLAILTERLIASSAVDA